MWTALQSRRSTQMTFIPFSATTRMSGVDLATDGQCLAAESVRKGAGDAVLDLGAASGSARFQPTCEPTVETIARAGGTPLVVAEKIGDEQPQRAWASSTSRTSSRRGMSERFDELRKMGIRTVMITGDNPLTASRHRRRRRAWTTSWRRRPLKPR